MIQSNMQPLDARLRGNDINGKTFLAVHDHASGFTLMEVLVSVAILAILLTTLYSGFVSSYSAMAKAGEKRHTMQSIRVIVEWMSQDIESMYFGTAAGDYPPTGLIGTNDQKNGIAMNRIDFTGLTHTSVGGIGMETDLAEIGYFAAPDTAGEGFILYRRDNPVVDSELREGGRVYMVSDGIGSFKIRYRDKNGKTVEEWDCFSETKTAVLPVLVEVSLELIEDENRRVPFTFYVHPGMAGTGT